MTKRTDMTGIRYGRLFAVCDVGRVSSGDRKWRFSCDCGSQFEAAGYAVRSGKVVSCPSCAAKRTAAASITHGKTDTDEYRIWTGILTRCKNTKAKAYQSYGGRGIGVCDQWANSFERFLEDMGLGHQKITRLIAATTMGTTTLGIADGRLAPSRPPTRETRCACW